MKKVICSVILFLVPVLIGTVVIPIAIWAFDGFPDGSSDGFWIPAMFGMYIGLPFGIIFGAVSFVVYLFRTRRVHQKEQSAEDIVKPLNSIETFDKY